MTKRTLAGPQLRISVGVVIGTIALLGTACGSSSSATTTPAPSKVTYDDQANAICQKFNAKLSSVGDQLSSSTQAAQVEQALESAIALAQQGTTKLEHLRRPAGENQALGAAYKAQEGQVADFKNLLSAVRANSASEVRSALATAQASDATLNQQFDALGLTTCGSGSSSTATT
jgi:hypothetical protein